MLAISAPNPSQACLFGFEPERDANSRPMRTTVRRLIAKLSSAVVQADMFGSVLLPVPRSNEKKTEKSIKKAVERRARKSMKRWTDAEILGQHSIEEFRNSLRPVGLEMHEWILVESLTVLTDEARAIDKLEVLEWIYSPDYIERLGITADGRPCVTRTHVFDIQFSFSNCCRVYGIDPDDLRENLLARVSPKLRDLLVEYVKHLTGMETVPVLHRRRRIAYRIVQTPSKTYGIHREESATSLKG